MRFFIGLAIFAFSFTAQAEYRAFELVITDSESGTEKIVLSTLDPNQYRRYYAIKLTETVKYQDTWRCRGNTSWNTPICPKPEKAPAK